MGANSLTLELLTLGIESGGRAGSAVPGSAHAEPGSSLLGTTAGSATLLDRWASISVRPLNSLTVPSTSTESPTVMLGGETGLVDEDAVGGARCGVGVAAPPVWM